MALDMGSTGNRTYTVRKGDTLETVASRTKTSSAQLKTRNKNISQLRPGQVIQVPGEAQGKAKGKIRKAPTPPRLYPEIMYGQEGPNITPLYTNWLRGPRDSWNKIANPPNVKSIGWGSSNAPLSAMYGQQWWNRKWGAFPLLKTAYSSLHGPIWPMLPPETPAPEIDYGTGGDWGWDYGGGGGGGSSYPYQFSWGLVNWRI